MRARRTASLSESVHQRLNSYALAASAAGVAVLALVLPAHAKVVYTHAHRRIPLNQDFFLDLNHDNINDFRFYIYTYDLNVQHQTGSADSAFMWIYAQGTRNGVVGVQPYASALRAGVRIGSKRLFNQGRGTMGAVWFPEKYFGPWADSGKPVNNRYLGLKFMIKGKTHYGWARFNVRVYRDPESTVSAVLTGYAYETIPNKPIITGKTKGPDVITFEPASLGRLARGASAISTWRKAGGNDETHG